MVIPNAISAEMLRFKQHASGLPSMVLTATGIGFLNALSLSVAAYTPPKCPAI